MSSGFCIQRCFAEMFSSNAPFVICCRVFFWNSFPSTHDFSLTNCCLGFLQDYVDAPLSIPVSLTQSLNIDWSEYQVSKMDVSVGGQGCIQEGSGEI